MVEDSYTENNSTISITDEYSYDSGSRLIESRKVDPTGDDLVIAYQYDGLNNLVKEIRLDSYTEYTYDSLNRLTYLSDYTAPNSPIEGTEVDYAYDSLDRVMQYTQDGESVNYVYRADGKLDNLYYEDHDDLDDPTNDITHIYYVYGNDNQLT